MEQHWGQPPARRRDTEAVGPSTKGLTTPGGERASGPAEHTCTPRREAAAGAARSTPETRDPREALVSQPAGTHGSKRWPCVGETLIVTWNRKFMRIFPVLMFVFKILFKRRLYRLKQCPFLRASWSQEACVFTILPRPEHCLGQGAGRPEHGPWSRTAWVPTPPAPLHSRRDA